MKLGDYYELRIYKRKASGRKPGHAGADRALYFGEGGLISDIVPDTADVTGYRRVDLHGHYILPGLINMHVHLAGSIEKGMAADLIVTAEKSAGRSAGIAESGAGSRTRQGNRTSCELKRGKRLI